MSRKTPPSPKTDAQACKSMTGYAQARVQHNGWALRISLRSVNHRFLDLHLRLPEGFDTFEPLIRQAVRERLRRGHVDVTLHFDPAGPAAVQVNRAMAEAYWKAADELRRQFGLKTEPDPVAVLRLPGVIAAGTTAGEFDVEEVERLGAQVTACLEEALGRLEEMRCAEGRHLVEEMRARLKQIGERAMKVEALAETIRPAYARRLDARLKDLLGETAMDPAQLARLRSHVEQFTKLLDGAGELGKKLDFLLQEMHREANTMLSKTPGVESEGLAITSLGLEIKGEIEKLREQVQNVE